jgi:hypothetical protein
VEKSEPDSCEKIARVCPTTGRTLYPGDTAHPDTPACA